MTRPVLHQFLTGATAGDAITDQALLMNRWLREMGFASEIFALHPHVSVEGRVRPLSGHRRGRGEKWAIYRHSIGSDVPDFLIRQGLRLVLIFHNVTPPEYFTGVDPLRAHLARLGIEQLAWLKPHTGLALADSTFNAADLRRAGFGQTDVLPICLQTERFDRGVNESLVAELEGGRPVLLFIGRLAPNKRQEDLVKLLYFLRRVRPEARLFLVGDRWEVGYDAWVEQLAADLGVREGLTLAGKVSQQDMITYMRAADFYVSMSEHEGFGVPLIESMYLGLPVVAYGAAAVPDTLGDAGILFYRKEYEALAELIDLVNENRQLRRRIVERQRDRVQMFLEPQVRRLFAGYLEQVGLC